VVAVPAMVTGVFVFSSIPWQVSVVHHGLVISRGVKGDILLYAAVEADVTVARDL
jgi:hypothetical protein